jgi:hypothetical protein
VPYLQFGASAFTILQPLGPQDYWTYQQLDEANLAAVDPVRLTELLTNLSPEVSRAFWDYLRLANNGYKVTVTSDATGEPDPRGEAVIAAVLERLTLLYGSPDAVWNRLFAGSFMRGMQLAEGVFAADRTTLVDIATPDPATIRFRMETDPIRGQFWQIGQLQAGKFVPLTSPSIRWVPVDPLPGNPYGRPMIAPAVYTAVFLLTLLHDLRRVVTMQGYPRMDIEVVLEQVKASAPPLVQSNPSEFRKWVEEILAEVENAYGNLAVDDAYIHTDNVKMNPPVGAADGRAFSEILQLVERVERMAARALKTMPILMGLSEGASEAQANRQWEIMSAGIKAIQHGTENVVGGIFDLALQAAGIQAHAEVRFAELRIAEAVRDAQVESLAILNTGALYDRGWISQDEAAESVVGHAPDQPEPRGPFGAGPAAPPIGNPEPGANRAGPRRRRFTPKAGPPPPEPPPAPPLTDADLARAAGDWDALVDDVYAGLLDAAVVP